MSKQHSGVYSAEEVEELRSRYSNEKVAALVAEAKALEGEEDLLGESDELEGDEGEGEGSGGADTPKEGAEAPEEGFDYNSLTVAELSELLKARELATTGNKPDLVARLEEDDARK